LRRFLPIILILVSALLDLAVLPVLIRSPYLPLMTLITTVELGLLLGRTRGSLFGMIGGLMIDLMTGYPMGLRTVLFIASGYVSGFAGRRFQRYILTPVVAPLACFLIYEAAMASYAAMSGALISGADMKDALIRLVIQVVLVQPLYLLFDRMLRPSWSRWAGR
jgi:rod shape-determining protein MreD